MMNSVTRRSLVGLVILLAVPATAAERAPFDKAAFSAAQAAGQTVLVHVTAPWCGTCEKQKPIVDKLTTSPAFASVAVFNVDFDTQKDDLKAFNARAQSTMVMFKGTTEVGRSVGDTKAASIEALMRKGL